MNIYSIDSAIPANASKVSFSQYLMYNECQYKWYLNYPMKRRISDYNIHLLFGTCLHCTLQQYLNTCYIDSVKSADNINLSLDLYNRMKSEFIKGKELLKSDPCTKNELIKAHKQGVNILEYVKKHRLDYFNTNEYEMIGIEVPITYEVRTNIFFVGYIDMVLKNKKTNKFIFFDFKTSNMGWKLEDKKNLKINQLILYKIFFSKKYAIDPESIDIEYFILKKNIIENSLFPIKYIQKFTPASGKSSRKKVLESFDSFLDNCFNSDGSYKLDSKYLAIGGDVDKKLQFKNCKYCQFKTDYEVCPEESRIAY